MTVTATSEPTTAPGPASALQASGRGAWGDGLFRVVTVAAAGSVLAILAFIAYSTTAKALPAFQHAGLSFVTSQTWNPDQGQFGTLAMIYGTVVTSAIALCLAVPVSIGIALYLSELAPRRIARPMSSIVDLLAAVPSVVFGLWCLLFLGPKLQGVYHTVHHLVRNIPVLNTLFGPDGTSQSLMTAGIVLSIMAIPIITSVSREVFATVPQGEKDAALALGATRWEMFRAAVFPHSMSGVTGAVMLGLGRAMGETIAVALVVGSQQQIRLNVFKAGDTLAGLIANQFSGESVGLAQDAVIGCGVLLFALTIVVNLIARLIVRRAERRVRGAA